METERGLAVAGPTGRLAAAASEPQLVCSRGPGVGGWRALSSHLQVCSSLGWGRQPDGQERGRPKCPGAETEGLQQEDRAACSCRGRLVGAREDGQRDGVTPSRRSPRHPCIPVQGGEGRLQVEG